jgi:hypothetical protein
LPWLFHPLAAQHDRPDISQLRDVGLQVAADHHNVGVVPASQPPAVICDAARLS